MMEELAFAKERSFKRKLMEAQEVSNGGHGGGGEVRRVHIIYYLSRQGSIEHPHLIRVHHFTRNGVYLKDVKRWLSELRGKGMPERFAWSYKRKYKGAHVWQDLVDEDLITPISDNEYVIKGSEISTAFTNDINSCNEKEISKLQNSPSFEFNVKSPKYPSREEEYTLDISTNTSSEIKESPSFGSETSTNDTTKNEDKHEDKEVLQSQNDEKENNPFQEIFFNKNMNHDNNNNKNNNKNNKIDNKTITTCSKTSSKSACSSKKTSCYSGSRASHMFRNWINCRSNDTHDKAMMVINKKQSGRVSTTSLVSQKSGKENNMGQICEEERLGGFKKSFEGQNGTKKSKKVDSNNFTFPAAYKPVNGPNCSQCRRPFKPEKLHTHMKYCRGMKASAKSRNSNPKPKTSTTPSPSEYSESAFYLTDN